MPNPWREPILVQEEADWPEPAEEPEEEPTHEGAEGDAPD
jgi:hypothetical protein